MAGDADRIGQHTPHDERLNPSRFDQRGTAHERDASPPKTTGTQRRLPLLGRPLTATCCNQHIEVLKLALGPFVGGANKRSMTSNTASGRIAAWQTWRIRLTSASYQSCSTDFNR